MRLELKEMKLSKVVICRENSLQNISQTKVDDGMYSLLINYVCTRIFDNISFV